jgi:hypothetical protein
MDRNRIARAGQHGYTQTGDAVSGQGVQVRRARGFQFCFATRFQGQTAQPIRHQQDDFGLVVFAQLGK